MAILQHSLNDMYSASAVDVAISPCSLLFQAMGDPPCVNM